MKEPRLDVMVDLETLDTACTACILSIGACTFNIYTGELFDTFYFNINLQSNLSLQRTISQSTFEWWMSQSNDAKSFILTKDKISLQKALYSFNSWFIGTKANRVWSNGENFDIAILEQAYNSLLSNIPWKYNQARDTRTIWDLYEEKFGEFEKPAFIGVKHNALADTVHQVKVLSTQFNKIVGGL